MKIGTLTCRHEGNHCRVEDDGVSVLVGADERRELAAFLLGGVSEGSRERTIANYQTEVAELQRERNAAVANAVDSARERDRQHVRANNAEARATAAERELDELRRQVMNAAVNVLPALTPEHLTNRYTPVSAPFYGRAALILAAVLVPWIVFLVIAWGW